MRKGTIYAQRILLQWTYSFLYLLLLLSPSLSKRNSELDEYGRTPLSKNITAILDRLVNKSTYDKRLRPNYGGEPVEVGITIYVSSISAVSEVEMDYTLDIYLRQMWTDRRLAFYAPIENITIDVEYMKSIWVPDTFFPNEKKSLAHTATTHNSFLRITTLGNVTTSQRLTVTASCAMNLLLFPLDSQECTLEIESCYLCTQESLEANINLCLLQGDGYAESDIIYNWQESNKVGVDEHAHTLPQFEMKNYTTNRRTQELSTGEYSRLQVRFVFVRNIGFYLMQIYLPSMLIVIISWVSFWLHRDASPARVALGVTTVLTMTTLMTTTNAQLPKVSYIKSIDIYLGVCFVMVFSSLLEYAAVSYLNKKMKMKRERKKQQETSQVQEFPMMPSTSKMSPATFTMESTGASFYPYAPSSQTDYQHLLPPNLNSTSPFNNQLECDCDLNITRPVPLRISRPRLRRRRINGVTPSTIDKYSRIIFPIAFMGFNAVYWTAYYFVAKNKRKEQDGYSTDDIKLVWLEGAKKSTDVEDTAKELPTFQLAQYWGEEATQVLSTGEYTRLRCRFIFKRNIGFYWIQIYQPSMMVVIISWVAFWINRDSAPARVTLGIMTVLTMTTLMTTTNRQMPKVSYVKAVDIYLVVCYIMVFAALLEYAAVSYSNKKIQDRKKKRQPNKTVLDSNPVGASGPIGASIPAVQSGPTTSGSGVLDLGGSSGVGAQQQATYWSERVTEQPDIIGQMKLQSHTSIRIDSSKAISTTNQREKISKQRKSITSSTDKKLQMAASGIDKYSRIVFPLVFAVFNILYWTIFLKKSDKI